MANEFFTSVKRFVAPVDKFLDEIGSPIYDWAKAQQKEEAMLNEEYADIQRRYDEANAELAGTDTSVMSSERYNIDIDDWFRQIEIEHEAAPDLQPVFSVAFFLSSKPLTRVTRWAQTATELVTRGWADEDTWGLNDVLAQRLGAMLIHLADNSHGWPSNDEFPRPEDWENALRLNGGKLLAYKDRWGTEDGETLSREEDNARDARLTKDAQDALHWVAEHFGHLWD